MSNQITISNFTEFHEIVGGIEANRHIFRGVTNADLHLLVPSIGRLSSLQRGNSGLPSFERRLFSQFKQMAIAYLQAPPVSDLDWLALAQHHGLPTRLLDWSYNPLVALYFALEGDTQSESAVYMYRARDKTVRSSEGIDPFDIGQIVKFSPDHASNRIMAQKGLFTIHPNPRDELLDDDRMTKVFIPNEIRSELRYILRRYDINPAKLFPGLDGLTAFIMER